MKILITAAGVAVLAIVLIEISLIEAQGDNRRCPEDRRPPINTTEVQCDKRQNGFALFACFVRCRQCYNRTQLQRHSACLVENKCQCLGNSSSSEGEGESSTTESGNLPTGSDDNSQQPSSESSLPGNPNDPSSEPPLVTSDDSGLTPEPRDEESTTGNGQENTAGEGAADQTTSASS